MYYLDKPLWIWLWFLAKWRSMLDRERRWFGPLLADKFLEGKSGSGCRWSYETCLEGNWLRIQEIKDLDIRDPQQTHCKSLPWSLILVDRESGLTGPWFQPEIGEKRRWTLVGSDCSWFWQLFPFATSRTRDLPLETTLCREEIISSCNLRFSCYGNSTVSSLSEFYSELS